MEPPPSRLVKLLEELELASSARVASMARRAGRLARGLPLLESAWVDALAQARLLSPWQAAQINAGRGEELRVGPFVLCRPLEWPDYGAAYQARQPGQAADYRIVLFAAQPGPGDPLIRLEALAARATELDFAGIAPIVSAGTDGRWRYAASHWVDGRSAAQWMVHYGRFPALAVLEIARQTVAALHQLERAGLCHGDLGPRALILTDAGQAVLLKPGLRGIVRPEEGPGQPELRPEAYDYLAPERAADRAPPSPASDRYALACLWWHLLAGRAPLAGGNGLAKLQAAQAGRVADLGPLVDDVPQALAGAIRACTVPDPTRRPASFAQLVSMLGPSDAAGRACLRRCLAGHEAGHVVFDPFSRHARPRRAPGVWPSLAAAGIVLLASVVGLIWLGLAPILVPKAQPVKTPVASRPAETTTAATLRAPPPPAEPPTPPALASKPRRASVDTMPLTPGTRIAAAPGERIEIAVPAGGWIVPVEGVSFENVDFVAARGTAEASGAMIRLEAARAEFRGCTFRASGQAARPIGVRWEWPCAEPQNLLSLPSGRVRFSDCAFLNLAAAVECRTQGVVALELSNTLALGGGPLVRAARCPTAEESLRVSLVRTTLRGTGPVLECGCDAIVPWPGPIVVQADQSALFPRPGSGLLVMTGPSNPERLWESVQWTGQGSLMGVDAMVAAWKKADGGSQAVDDARLAISGLARSQVEFAGAVENGAEASRITRWQGPLRSADPPGVDSSRLPTIDFVDAI